MPDCLFCKIALHEIPSKTVYECPEAIAFLDIHPLAPGHTVVIPKIHASTVTKLNTNVIGPFFLCVKQVTHMIDMALKPDGYNIGWNHGEAGGQAVGHLHVHVIPRWKGDGGGSMHSIVHNPPTEDLDKIYEKLKAVGE
jgi:histidine triad (HIT) family protein